MEDGGAGYALEHLNSKISFESFVLLKHSILNLGQGCHTVTLIGLPFAATCLIRGKSVISKEAISKAGTLRLSRKSAEVLSKVS